MKVQVSAFDSSKLKGAVVLLVAEGNKPTTFAKSVDENTSIISSTNRGRFTGGFKQIQEVTDKETDYVLAGLGKKVAQGAWRKLGLSVGKKLESMGVAEATVLLDGDLSDVTVVEAACEFAEGADQAFYRLDEFKSDMKAVNKSKFKKMNIMVSEPELKAVKAALKDFEELSEAVYLARNLVNLPGNIVTPDYMEEQALQLKTHGVKVDVYDEKKLKKLGMNLMLSVGNASKYGTRMIVMTYNGAKKTDPMYAMVGKGITFDTGGYSLKPAANMIGMHADMGGAAAVMGALRMLAGKKAKVNVTAVLAVAENMVSPDATRPSDIVTGYAGKSVEILNTDAEGRLVLCDAMAWTVDKVKPAEILDIATLTGACMMALGAHYAGGFSNNDELFKGLEEAGNKSGDRVWRLPIGPEYHAMLESDFADMANIGGMYAGATTAACFLEKFVDDTPWAHIDVAGVAMGGKLGPNPEIKGGTGFGVKLLATYMESKAK